jgi:hypothetical protein
MGECVSAYFILATVLPSTAHSWLPLLGAVTVLPIHYRTGTDMTPVLSALLRLV